MSLAEVDFLFFFPLAFGLYWLMPRKAAWQNATLLLLGYVFYYSWNPTLVWVIALATAVDFGVTRYLANHPVDGTEATRRRRRAALWVSVVYNVGQLCWFKYVGFFAASLNDLLGAVGLSPSLPVLRLALPIGLSYYTLQKLAYVLDVYHERYEACRSPLRFATFVAFFPQLIAGPITRGDQLLPQLEKPRRLDPDVLRAGAFIFLFGFTLKAYVGDWLGQNVADPVFNDPQSFTALGHWLGVLGYAGQVFGDFAGYSFMAIGVGRAFGIELPVNFDRPFVSKNLMELWRRWHITLNTWLFDYLYGPMTTSRGWWRGRLDLGFVVVFMVSGLWHGAAWGFVLWGLLHGLGLVVQRRWDVYYRGLCKQDRVWVKRRKTRWYATGGLVLTQLFFLVSLVPFRAVDGAATLSYLGGLFVGPGGQLPVVGAGIQALGNMALCFGFLVAYHLLGVGPFARWKERFFTLPAPVRGVAYGVVLVALGVLMPASSGAFVYAQF